MVNSLVDASDGIFLALTRLLGKVTQELRCHEHLRSSSTISRKSDLTMLYNSEHGELLHEIEKFEIKIPSSVSGNLTQAPVTERERSLLRSFIGGLQSPARLATQTSPHLQVGISTLARETSKAPIQQATTFVLPKSFLTLPWTTSI